MTKDGEKHFKGQKISEVILGSQDGIVNVLGVVLGVASATNNSLIILVAGLAAAFAETISMGAVAYTSVKAERDYHKAERKLEEWEVEETPEAEAREIRSIYAKKGFKGSLLNQIVKVITSNKKVWVDTMMAEELNLPPVFQKSPWRSGLLVLIATLLGSLGPILPFFWLSVSSAVVTSLFISIMLLFVIGALKAKLTVGNWFLSGAELAVIGIVAALVGYLMGFAVGEIFGTRALALG